MDTASPLGSGLVDRQSQNMTVAAGRPRRGLSGRTCRIGGDAPPAREAAEHDLDPAAAAIGRDVRTLRMADGDHGRYNLQVAHQDARVAPSKLECRVAPGAANCARRPAPLRQLAQAAADAERAFPARPAVCDVCRKRFVDACRPRPHGALTALQIGQALLAGGQSGVAEPAGRNDRQFRAALGRPRLPGAIGPATAPFGRGAEPSAREVRRRPGTRPPAG